MTGQATVLVVDDEPTIAAFLAELLTDEGYRVQVVSNGLCALAAVTAAPPSLVLLDILLPSLSGWEVFRRLRDEHGYQDPIVLMSAGFNSGNEPPHKATAYLPKPFNTDELLACVAHSISLPLCKQTC